MGPRRRTRPSAEADTRIWITPEGLRLLTVRDHLLEILRGRTVINLDATPSPLLRRLFPDLREVCYEAAAPMVVTQITDTIATRTELTGERNPRRDRIARALDAVTQDAVSPVIFGFKAFDPNVTGDGPKVTVGNPIARYGHFDGETRGVNRFSDADVLCVVGRYSAPLDELRALVQGIRFGDGPRRAAIAARDARGRPLKLRPYSWRAEDGSGLARWSPADDDPDVDALVRWSETASVLQAIGRGRAVRRPADAPLRVYLFTSNPVDGLAVDHLVKLAELGAPPSARGTSPAFVACIERRAAANAAASAETRGKVARAVAQLIADRTPVTARAVAALAGVRRQTLYEDPALRAMVDQARERAASGAVTGGVPPGSGDEYSEHVPGGTLPVTGSEEGAAAALCHPSPVRRPSRAVGEARQGAAARSGSATWCTPRRDPQVPVDPRQQAAGQNGPRRDWS